MTIQMRPPFSLLLTFDFKSNDAYSMHFCLFGRCFALFILIHAISVCIRQTPQTIGIATEKYDEPHAATNI